MSLRSNRGSPVGILRTIDSGESVRVALRGYAPGDRVVR
jgi:hypothetical protein